MAKLVIPIKVIKSHYQPEIPRTDATPESQPDTAPDPVNLLAAAFVKRGATVTFPATVPPWSSSISSDQERPARWAHGVDLPPPERFNGPQMVIEQSPRLIINRQLIGEVPGLQMSPEELAGWREDCYCLLEAVPGGLIVSDEPTYPAIDSLTELERWDYTYTIIGAEVSKRRMRRSRLLAL